MSLFSFAPGSPPQFASTPFPKVLVISLPTITLGCCLREPDPGWTPGRFQLPALSWINECWDQCYEKMIQSLLLCVITKN